MRPLRLEFQAFGSFPGKQVVDFKELGQRGLFVVTGPTGTGKTTVFDAMVYALYGALPGGRSADGDARSHHAAADVETYATLEFEVDGVRYSVHRSPKWDKPKKNGSGTTSDGPHASLVKLIDKATESLATGSTNVATKCKELVGLDGTQFQRVVLLPQGKFTDFLIAPEADREKLLRQLFSGEVFEEATKHLKRQMDKLNGQVSDVDIQVQHHRTNAVDSLADVREAWMPELDDPKVDLNGAPLAEASDDRLRELIELLAPVRRQRDTQVKTLQAAATKATADLTEAEGEAKRFNDAVSVTSDLAVLERQRESVAANEQLVAASQRARPVFELAGKLELARSDAEQAQSKLAEFSTAVTRGFEALDLASPALDAAAVAAAVQAAATDFAADRETLNQAAHAASEAAEAEAAVIAANDAHQILEASITSLQAGIDELGRQVAVLAPAASSVDRLEREVDTASARVDQRDKLERALAALPVANESEAQAKLTYESVMAQFVLTTAPRLAEELVDGEPCSVCGSPEHPHPAQVVDGESVDHDDVDSARGVWSRATEEVQKLGITIEGLREVLAESADISVAHLATALSDLVKSLAEARSAAAEVVHLQRRIDAENARLLAEQGSERSASLLLNELQTIAKAKRKDADRLGDVAAAIDAEALDAKLIIVGELRIAAADASALFEGVAATRVTHDAVERDLAVSLAVSGYADIAIASAAVLDRDEETAFGAESAHWHAEVSRLNTILEQLRKQGIPEVCPDLAQLQSVADEASHNARHAADAFTTAANALKAADDELVRSIKIAAGSAGLRAQRDTARIVFKTCNGEAGMGVKLERWVLAGELDRVTAAANVHLGRMTNLRYKLARAAGLTLEVFDAHTGRSRATASLSGGEQFQASLSLALGLADVVSRGGVGSGKQFEALFVDEGFGSLDPNSLDDAIRALSLLQAAGRMVGAITHVEAMKERLHVGIEVKPLADGRGSTLVVNP